MTIVTQRGLEPIRHVLGNGAVVIAKEAHTIPAVTISVAFEAGSASDPAPRIGLAHFLGRVIDRGTERRSADAIAEELDGRGVALSIGVTRHLFSLSCTCLSDDFEAMLDLIADIAIHPVFPDEEIATRRGEVITAIRQDEDSPAVMAVETLLALLYSDGHPYGRRTKGTIETVESMTRLMLLEFHAAKFAPSALSVVIVGDVVTSRAIEAAARMFEGWESPGSTPLVLPRATSPAARRRLVVPMMNKSQADIAYGFIAVARMDPDYYACWVMNNALGQYALGGRLGDSIRERQGMAYYVFSSLDANVVEGPLIIRAGVNPLNVDRAIASIDEEISGAAASGLTEREVAESKQYLIGSLPRNLETNAGIASFLQTAEFFGLGLDYDLRLPGLVAAVTRDEVNHAARRLLATERATAVIAGPYPPGGEREPRAETTGRLQALGAPPDACRE